MLSNIFLFLCFFLFFYFFVYPLVVATETGSSALSIVHERVFAAEGSVPAPFAVSFAAVAVGEAAGL